MTEDAYSVDVLRADLEIANLADQGTDVDNSAFFSRRAKGRLLYNHPARYWMIYDGKRWRRDENGSAVQLAKNVVREMQRLAIAVKNETQRAKAMKHAMASMSRRKIDAMMYLAQPDLAADVGAFDVDHYALNVANGTLDIRSRKLRPHCADDFITKLAPVSYDPHANCERWLRFVEEIMESDADLADFLQRFVGLCLSGITVERLLAILYGIGANGKTTLLNVIGALLGDYGATVDPALFVAQHDARSASPELVRLAGKRFVSASELPEGGKLSEGLLKRLTGNEFITARALYADTIEFAPTWKIVFATNHRPIVKDDSEGFWDRLHLVPFAARFDNAQRDPNLGATLQAELSGILNWALDGFDRYQLHGLNRPRRIASATSAYRAESDIIGSFIAERCVVSDDAEVRGTLIYAEFTAWAKSNGEMRVPATRSFYPKLRDKGGFSTRKSHGDLIFHGIGLLHGDGPQHPREDDSALLHEENVRERVPKGAEVPGDDITFPSNSFTGELCEIEHLSTPQHPSDVWATPAARARNGIQARIRR